MWIAFVVVVCLIACTLCCLWEKYTSRGNVGHIASQSIYRWGCHHILLVSTPNNDFDVHVSTLQKKSLPDALNKLNKFF